MKLKKSDEIIVTAGKDKGKRGKIEAVNSRETTVLVLGVNMYKRHTKKPDEKNPGAIVDTGRPLPIGNVALICPTCKKPTRIGYEIAQSEKHRICKKCKQMI